MDFVKSLEELLDKYLGEEGEQLDPREKRVRAALNFGAAICREVLDGTVRPVDVLNELEYVIETVAHGDTPSGLAWRIQNGQASQIEQQLAPLIPFHEYWENWVAEQPRAGGVSGPYYFDLCVGEAVIIMAKEFLKQAGKSPYS